MPEKHLIGFDEALNLTLSTINPVETQTHPLLSLTGKILATDIIAVVDSPSRDASLKDGYAVVSSDIQTARMNQPITLSIKGDITAGALQEAGISSGETYYITTGSTIPSGSTAVLSEEYSSRSASTVTCFNTAEPGRNILRKGTDIKRGDVVARKGETLSPPLIGLLACAGINEASIYRSPRVAVIATGDEVVAPGHPLPEGKLYASNVIEICSWLSLFHLTYHVEIVRDSKKKIAAAIARHLSDVDAFITSGGAWGSHRDMIIDVLEDLKWECIYHRVRLGPGKAIGFGLLGSKPFFCLPGGPPSNEMAFLQLALPGILKMMGRNYPIFPAVRARLLETVHGDMDWTQFIHVRLIVGSDGRVGVDPIKQRSRIQSMARKDGLICIPEGTEQVAEHDLVDVQIFHAIHINNHP